MTMVGHMLNKPDGICAGCNMDGVIHPITYLGHFLRECNPAGFTKRLCAIDVKYLVLQGYWLAIECQLRCVEERVIGRLYDVLTSLVDIEDHTTRLQNAKVVALHSKQRTMCNVVLGIAPQENT